MAPTDDTTSILLSAMDKIDGKVDTVTNTVNDLRVDVAVLKEAQKDISADVAIALKKREVPWKLIGGIIVTVAGALTGVSFAV